MTECRKYKVYMLQSTDGRVYIGMTGQPINSRCRPSGYRGCPEISKAIETMGWGAFEKSVIVEGLTKTEAELVEKALIVSYDSTNLNKGFNVALGGNIVGRHSKATRLKMSVSQKGRVFTQTHRTRLHKPKKGGCFRRTVRQFTQNGALIAVHDSVEDAARSVQGFKESIMRCCNHKQRTCKGFIWEYGGYGYD